MRWKIVSDAIYNMYNRRNPTWKGVINSKHYIEYSSLFYMWDLHFNCSLYSGNDIVQGW